MMRRNGYAMDVVESPNVRALDHGVARSGAKAGEWLWSDAFLRALLKATGCPGFDDAEPAIPPRTASNLLREGVALLHGSRTDWNDGAAFLKGPDPACAAASKLQFEAVLANVALDHGIPKALAAIKAPLWLVWSAVDREHPDVVKGSALIHQALRDISSIDGDHPLIRYGIIPTKAAA